MTLYSLSMGQILVSGMQLYLYLIDN